MVPTVLPMVCTSNGSCVLGLVDLTQFGQSVSWLRLTVTPTDTCLAADNVSLVSLCARLGYIATEAGSPDSQTIN